MFPKYDVIVVGAGHAGCEAAAAAANLGSTVLLVTMNMQAMGQMSCNPAMGGIAKGQIVREIDAMGGYSGIVTDESTIQFRMLNRSKGVAVWSPRAQNDRVLFSLKWREMLEKTQGVDFFQDQVVGLLIKGDMVYGVKTKLGHHIEGTTVVLTNGTFLNGLIHIGKEQQLGGRIGEANAPYLTEQLLQKGFETERLKTGTPPRIDGRSINYSVMERQDGDEQVVGFSYLPTQKIAPEKQLPCYITMTNPQVHETLREGFADSPMFNGTIEGTGPRYCPSIEDKINRFADRDRHQLFVEPEGFNTVEIYLNGFSTSLPQATQIKALRQIQGLEQCKIFRPGYAVEYDFFPPTQLHYSLETRLLKRLFFAGQINGTTGYEEAACQGLMAGINAHLACKDLAPLILRRDQAYIGVLIDDLVSKGTQEPYRMFTSRAEFRTLLRQDNADLRLTPLAYQLGLASEERKINVERKEQNVAKLIQLLSEASAQPEQINPYLERMETATIKEKTKVAQLLLRPNLSLEDLKKNVAGLDTALEAYTIDELEQAEVQMKYKTYIDREVLQAEKMKNLEELRIPAQFNYERIVALGTEAREKFNKIRPETLGQAARISGINPVDVSILAVYLGR